MKQIFEPNQRIIILQALAGDNDYALNNSMLQKILVGMGHSIGLEKTNTEIAWLKKQALVSVENLDGDLKIVKLTRKGLDVAHGHERIDGVDRPDPE